MLSLLLIPIVLPPAQTNHLYVSTTGSDQEPGTRTKPFASLARALKAIESRPKKTAVVVHVRGGTYYLPETLTFTPAHSGTKNAKVKIVAEPKEEVVVSGGQKLNLNWRPFRDGIYQATVPAGLETEELFVNGQRQILARYPNFNPKERIFNGYAEDAISRDRVAKWSDPTGGYFHAMHPAEWGDFTWRITGKSSEGDLKLEGGWQNNRPAGPHSKHRFVENIFEELDAPGEWFLDKKNHTLYFYPPTGTNLSTAKVEATRLRTLVRFKGNKNAPVEHIQLVGLTFRHAARTVMETKERLLRTDWAIHRGGALLYERATDCELEDCLLDQLGGNAVFVNGFNRRLTFRTLHVTKAGASGFHFVGNPAAARSALFNYNQTLRLENIDRTPGPLTDDYPADCVVEDCLIELTGRIEKQTAGVNIDLAMSITVRNCSIYDMPRAGINIGDGCWGGHLIENCDVFDTVKETGDHGSFNSWGRDRFWNPDIEITNQWVAKLPNMPFWDAMQPNVLRHNRWRCDHGWDIDLDDGSSNYIITENLCLNGGIKNREGYKRIVTNNIMVNNGFHPHVWYANSGDVFRNNIVWANYAPARMYPAPWPDGLDANFHHIQNSKDVRPATRLQATSGQDKNSLAGNALFYDAAHGDYRLQSDSPVLKLGFKNFRMDNFGVRSAKLRSIARVPAFPLQPRVIVQTVAATDTWLGSRVRDIQSEGDRSAYGLPSVAGVLIVDVTSSSALANAGIRSNDVVLAINGRTVKGLEDLSKLTPKAGKVKLLVQRQQTPRTVVVILP